jgi:hypothetical protein
MELWLFVFTGFIATYILTKGRIFDFIRPKYYFFHCPLCVGFHVGWASYLIYFGLSVRVNGLDEIGYLPASCFIAALLVSGVSYISWLVLNYFFDDVD